MHDIYIKIIVAALFQIFNDREILIELITKCSQDCLSGDASSDIYSAHLFHRDIIKMVRSMLRWSRSLGRVAFF